MLEVMTSIMSNIQVPHKLILVQNQTPIVYLEKISKKISEARNKTTKLYLKRDDLTHGIAAGNKIRKLEYLFADAREKNASVIVTCGGVQSNHARATAALGAQLGFEVILILKGEYPSSVTGNFLLDQIFGARTILVSDNQYQNLSQIWKMIQSTCRNEGKTAYFIPEGGSNEIGLWGYVSCLQEIKSQAGSNGLPARFDSVICATGSGGTYAGLFLGALLNEWDDGNTQFITYNVCGSYQEFRSRIISLLSLAIQRYRLPLSFFSEDIKIVDGYWRPKYGVASQEVFLQIIELARLEGILLDPVYTGKCFQGLVTELINVVNSTYEYGENILFIHTGGFPSIFSQGNEFIHALSASS